MQGLRENGDAIMKHLFALTLEGKDYFCSEEIFRYLALMNKKVHKYEKVIAAAKKYAAAEFAGAEYPDWVEFTNALKELEGDVYE